MATPAQKLNDWIEYKMLVLAELERLNDCVDKLQEGHNATNGHINDLRRDHKEVMAAIDVTNKRIDSVHPLTPEAKWKFYAAVVALVATAIASFVSLVITILTHGTGTTPTP